MQIHHDESLANCIDPESCAGVCEGIGEALTGEGIERRSAQVHRPHVPQLQAFNREMLARLARLVVLLHHPAIVA